MNLEDVAFDTLWVILALFHGTTTGDVLANRLKGQPWRRIPGNVPQKRHNGTPAGLGGALWCPYPRAVEQAVKRRHRGFRSRRGHE